MALFNMVNASKFHLHRDVLAASYWQFFGAFSAHFLWQPKWQSVTSKYTWILIDQTFVVQNLQMCLLYSLNSNINRNQWGLQWILSNQCCRFGKTAWLEETRVDVEDSSYITYLYKDRFCSSLSVTLIWFFYAYKIWCKAVFIDMRKLPGCLQ